TILMAYAVLARTVMSRALFLVVLIIQMPSTAPAQEEEPAGPGTTVETKLGQLPEPSPLQLYEQFTRGKIMRNIGIALTIAGPVMMSTAAWFTFLSSFQCDHGSCPPETDRDQKIALGIFLGGAGALGAGIPLLVVGVRNMREARRLGYREWTPLV